MKKTNPKIVFLTPYPFDTAPGQRFRFEQYFEILKQNGFQITCLSFLSLSTMRVLYKKGHVFEKMLGVVLGFLRRLCHLFLLKNSDFVFIYREASPIGFPLFEWLIAKVLKIKIIYDFDDAIWLPTVSEENKLAERLKYQQKVALICRWSHKVSVGNHFLQEFALQFNKNSVYNPTTINTTTYHNKSKDHSSKELVVGWTGSHSTLKYIEPLLPVLKKLEQTIDFTFVLISDKPIETDLKSFRFVKWNKATEIDDLLQFNVGLMPLTDDDWSKGKCGFKALQYMALGIPPLVSPVGANQKIIAHGTDGFWCENEQDWFEHIAELLKNQDMRVKIGQAGMEKVQKYYSVASNTDNFLSLFS